MIFLVVLLISGITASIGDEILLQEFMDANLKFTADLYKNVAGEITGNLVLCPLSVQIVLSMLHAGANKNTSSEIASALYFEDNTDKIQEIFKNISPLLQTNDPYLMTSANKMYVAHNVLINEDYKEIVTDVFKAEIENINFTNTVQARNKINEWVKKTTNNGVKDLVGENDLTPNTVTSLINAMFLDAKWEYQFLMKKTRVRTFYMNNIESMKIDTMKLQYDFNYYEDRELDAAFLKMPLEGQDLEVVFVLPKKRDGLKVLEARISEVLVEHPFQEEDVFVYLPKFQMETPINLNSALQNMGIVEAYSANANFSEISDNPMAIDNVLQKSFIAFTEKGTTAGNSTGISDTGRLPPEFTFDMNHPFMYYIKHRNIGIVFIGRVVTPENVEE